MRRLKRYAAGSTILWLRKYRNPLAVPQEPELSADKLRWWNEDRNCGLNATSPFAPNFSATHPGA